MRTEGENTVYLDQVRFGTHQLIYPVLSNLQEGSAKDAFISDNEQLNEAWIAFIFMDLKSHWSNLNCFVWI